MRLDALGAAAAREADVVGGVAESHMEDYMRTWTTCEHGLHANMDYMRSHVEETVPKVERNPNYAPIPRAIARRTTSARIIAKAVEVACLMESAKGFRM